MCRQKQVNKKENCLSIRMVSESKKESTVKLIRL